MITKPLDHYVRPIRIKKGLTQKDITHLLECPSIAKVSFIERFRLTPKIYDALALSIILDEPMEALFQGMYQQAVNMVRENAAQLVHEMECADGYHSERHLQRLEALRVLAQIN